MESRKITIVSTKTQKKSVIMSEAETLRELKHDLDNAGIDYSDMTFYEGTSKTELKTDDSVLPKDVPYTNRTTGETVNTNELVFMLTNPNKKIKSGAMSRPEMYDYVRTNNLKDVFLRKYGKNFTQCSSASILDVINEHKATNSSCASSCVDDKVRQALDVLTDALYEEDYINKCTRNKVKDLICDNCELNSSYSDSEISDMFEDLYN